MKVAVIGAGPHGLAAAKAALDEGLGVDIFDRQLRPANNTHGVFYLSKELGMLLPRSTIMTRWIPEHMDPEEAARLYSQKLYGHPNQSVSVTSGVSYGFHGGAFVEQMFAMLESHMIEKTFESRREVVDLLRAYSRVIVTIPAPVLMPEKSWPSRDVWVSSCLTTHSWNKGTVSYYPSPDIPETRVSTMFGRTVVERATHANGYRKIPKVITARRDNFDGWPPEVMFEGRYGAWDKSILVVDTYRHVSEALEKTR
jgi:hypothetical protein